MREASLVAVYVVLIVGILILNCNFFVTLNFVVKVL